MATNLRLRPEAALALRAEADRTGLSQQEILRRAVDEHLSVPSGSTLSLLRRRRALVERLARANRVDRVRVFGSVARGDDGPASDIDVLVDPCPDATLFDLAQFEMDLESLFDRPVDVVSSRSLDPRRDAGIVAEAITL